MSEASSLTIDFSSVPDHRQHASGKTWDVLPTDRRPRTGDGKLLTAKQIRARARRRAKRADLMSEQEQEVLYRKPIEDWDLQELAKGRPRAADGTFRGPKPSWITREVHERSMELFKAAVKSDMNATTVDALGAIKLIIENDEVDDKGKPIVPAGTKLDAAKFLIEHVVGKPKQVLEADISVKLQGILATVMANPADTFMSQETGGEGYTVGHLPGVTIPYGEIDNSDSDLDEGSDG